MAAGPAVRTVPAGTRGVDDGAAGSTNPAGPSRRREDEEGGHAPAGRSVQSALRNIEPTNDDKDNAPQAHCEVSDVLAADETLCSWGVNTVLIGSYKRHVSIRRMKDVDVPSDVYPATVLKEFERVLRNGFPAIDGKSRVKRQARSFQVGFPEFDGLYVDAVLARPWTRWDGTHAWELPKRGEDGWQPTNPEELIRLSTLMNDADHADGLYVPTVKLLRQLRRARMGKRRPGGLTVELAAWHAFNNGSVTGTTQTEVFVSALRATANVLTLAFVYGLGLNDPTLPGEKITVRAEDADKAALATSSPRPRPRRNRR